MEMVYWQFGEQFAITEKLFSDFGWGITSEKYINLLSSNFFDNNSVLLVADNVFHTKVFEQLTGYRLNPNRECLGSIS